MSNIFISHSSSCKDNKAGKSLRKVLTEAGYQSMFLDFDEKDGIPWGENWEEELYAQLKICKSVIALCSKDYVKSYWCFVEIKMARAMEKDIVPIILDEDGFNVIPDVQGKAIDFNKLGDQEAYAKVLDKLKKDGLDPNDSFPWDRRKCPYPGMMAFEAKHAAIYFGRDKEIERGIELLDDLRDWGGSHLVLVLGASGSGKSSLVKAGLLPRLQKQKQNWLVLEPFRPRQEPFEELGDVVQKCFDRYDAGDEGANCRTLLVNEEASANDKAKGFLTHFKQLKSLAGHRHATTLVTVDQMEELLGDGLENQANQFSAFLKSLLDNEKNAVIVLGTLRSDFLGIFQTDPVFRSLIPKILMVNPLEPDAIAQVIQGPADVVGVKLEDGLRERLVNDTKSGNALPLLAFTLQKLYQDYGQDQLLKINEYEQMGGLTGSVAQTAQRILDFHTPINDPLRSTIEDALRRAFLKLVRINEEGKAVRKQASWEELPDLVHSLLDRFIGEKVRLLTVSGEQRLVEVSHEALFDAWSTLKTWINESREHLLQKQRFEATAKEWQTAKRSKTYLLTDQRLQELQDFIDKYGEDFPLNELGQEFLVANQEANAVKNFFIQACSIVRTMKSSKNQVLNLVAIAKSEAQVGEIDEARNVLEQALSIARAADDSEEKGQMLVEIEQAYRQVNETDVEKLEEVIREANGFFKTVIAIAKAASQLPDPQTAQSLLEQALQAAKTIELSRSRSDALRAIAETAIQLQDTKAAQSSLEQALQAAKIREDSSGTSYALREIAKTASQLQDTKAAQSLIEQTIQAAKTIEDPSSRSHALRGIANTASQLQDPKAAQSLIEQALQAAKIIEDPSWRSDALRVIAETASQLQDAKTAQSSLEQALQAAKTIELSRSRSDALRAIANAASQLQDAKTAQSLIEQALQAAKIIEDPSWRSDALRAIAETASQLQDAKTAQ